MSESAPSTSGPAPAGEPTAGPAPSDSQVPAAAPSRDLDTAEPEAGSPTGNLPGVLDHDPDDADLQEALFAGQQEQKSKGTKKKAAGRDRPRDPKTGQFVGGGEAAQPEGAEPEAPEGSEPEPGPDAGKGKFKFAGEDWDDQSAAEQNFRSLRGTYKAEVERANTNWTAYEAWKADSEGKDKVIAELRARNAELEKSGQPGSGREPEAGAQGQAASKEGLLKNIDMDAYSYLVVKGGPAAGAEYLVESLLEQVNAQRASDIKAVREEVQRELEQALGPTRQRAEQEQSIDAMTQAATTLAALQKSDGSPAFPELRDAKQVEEIALVWARESQDEQDAERRLKMLRRPDGLLNAIAFYRMVKGFSAPTTTAEPASPGNGQDLPAARVAPGAAATVSESPGGFTPGTRTAEGMAAIVSGLDKTNLVDEDLGFSRNR